MSYSQQYTSNHRGEAASYAAKLRFVEKLREMLKDEEEADIEYKELSTEAKELGFTATAKTLRRIALDEASHKAILAQRIREIEYKIRRK